MALVTPPNGSLRDNRGSSITPATRPAGMGDRVNLPDHRFHPYGMPQPPSATSIGHGMVPVEPFRPDGLPSTAMPVSDMPRAK